MHTDHVHKSAIIIPFGLSECTRMQFRLGKAAATFQWLMDQFIRDLPFVFVFIDDTLVASRTLEEHLENPKILFELLQECGLILNHLKCILEVSSIEFLGYKVS